MGIPDDGTCCGCFAPVRAAFDVLVHKIRSTRRRKEGEEMITHPWCITWLAVAYRSDGKAAASIRMQFRVLVGLPQRRR